MGCCDIGLAAFEVEGGEHSVHWDEVVGEDGFGARVEPAGEFVFGHEAGYDGSSVELAVGVGYPGGGYGLAGGGYDEGVAVVAVPVVVVAHDVDVGEGLLEGGDDGAEEASAVHLIYYVDGVEAVLGEQAEDHLVEFEGGEVVGDGYVVEGVADY